MPIDPDGNLWYPIEEYEAEKNHTYTQEEIDETTAEMDAWDASPEGQEWAKEWEQRETERKQRAFDPTRLTNRVEISDHPLIFAQAVQAIYDETGKPCRLREAGERAEMDSDEYIVAGAFATVQKLVRHPIRQGLICTSLFEPGGGLMSYIAIGHDGEAVSESYDTQEECEQDYPGFDVIIEEED